MKIAAVLLALAIVGSLLWIGGEMHRQNCIRAGRVSCSVVPWDNGHLAPRHAPVTRPLPLGGKLPLG